MVDLPLSIFLTQELNLRQILLPGFLGTFHLFSSYFISFIIIPFVPQCQEVLFTLSPPLPLLAGEGRRVRVQKVLI